MLAAAGASMLVAVVLPTHLRQDDEWATIAARQRAVLAEAAGLVARGHRVVTVGPGPVGTAAVEGINNSWDGNAALRWTTGRPDAELVVAPDERALALAPVAVRIP